jgi:general secretion pathway protein G
MTLMDTYKNYMHGFTIVELLIVIVVVAILAAVTVGAYQGTQGRAKDAQRAQDLKAISKALELYKVQTGSYPAPSTGSNTTNSWEVSSKSPAQFLSVLVTSGVLKGKVPVDPVNTVDGMEYKYYRYSSTNTSNGCTQSRGDYYVLLATKAESTSGQLSSSPGFSCPGRNWSIEGGWVTGGYTNG